MDSLEQQFTNVYSQALKINSDFQIQQRNHDQLLKNREDLKAQLEQKIHTHLIYEKSIEYFKEILQLLSQSHIEHIEELLNTSVKKIFYDKDYSIKLVMGEYKNSNTLTINLIETKPDGTQVTTNINDNGFGIKSIVGFVLQIYFIFYYKLSPILFMDEAFTYLSSQYIENLKELLNELTKAYGFIFVLVSHDNRLIDISDNVYTIENGEVKNG